MEDKLLKMFFEKDRWEYAIAKGVGKDIPKNVLFQLCKPEMRLQMCKAIREGQYEIAPPHTALIPKETPGEFRTVYVNEAADRVLLSIANDLLFELMSDRVHPRCKSYLKGVGCGRVVPQFQSIPTRRTNHLRRTGHPCNSEDDSRPHLDRLIRPVEPHTGHEERAAAAHTAGSCRASYFRVIRLNVPGSLTLCLRDPRITSDHLPSKEWSAMPGRKARTIPARGTTCQTDTFNAQ